MTTIKHLDLILALTLCALTATTQAQTPRLSTINVTAEADRLHIAAQGDVSEMRIEVVSESGDVVFESGAITGNQLDWNMRDAAGERVQPGTYHVTVTFRTASGKLRKRVEQVTVEEAEPSSTQPANAPQAPQETVTTSNPGIFGTMARFTGAATIANSVITQSTAGNVGIGTTAPTAKLHLSAVNSRLRLRSTDPNAWTVTEYVTDNQEWHTGVGGSTVPYGLNGKFYIYDETAQQLRMVINTAGKVGIGTNNPTTALLHVDGGCCSGVFGNSSGGMGVWGNSSSANGVFGQSYTGNGVEGQRLFSAWADVRAGRAPAPNDRTL